MAMKKRFNISNVVLLLLAWTIVGLAYTECKQLPLLSLTAREVYRLLRQAGREDAVPEGRVITQGLAAMAGFALGLKKALTGVLIYDFITANVTDLDLGLGNVVNTTSTNTAAIGTRQEICFNSRKSRNLEEADAVAEAYEWLDEYEGKLGKGRSRKSKAYRHHRRNKRHDKANSRQATTTGVGTTSTNDPTTDVDSPTSVTNPTTTTGSLPTTAGDTGTGISTATTTLTGNEPATNCIVLHN